LASIWGPTTQSSNRSPPAPGTEISCAETGRQKPALQLVETDSETRRKRGSPHSRAQIARLLAKVQTLRLGGGRTRARTWDPMIKSHSQVVLVQSLFRHVLVSTSIKIVIEFSLVGMQGRRERVIGSNHTEGVRVGRPQPPDTPRQNPRILH
jgi:hypothetical protein